MTQRFHIQSLSPAGGTAGQPLVVAPNGLTVAWGDAPAGAVHTHTSNEVSDFTEAVQDTVGAMLTSGANVTLTYDDTAGTVTVTASGGDAELMRDTIGTALVGINGVTVTVNDAADTITLSVTGLTISQTTGLQAALDGKSETGHTHAAAGITVQDENGSVGTGITQIDFQGAGVTTTLGTGEVIVTIPGGGAGGVTYGTAADLADVDAAAESAGVSDNVARADHKHDVSTAAPAAISGGSQAEGTANSLARSDHQHGTPTGIPQANVTNLTTDLAGKAATAHNHTKANITDLTADDVAATASLRTLGTGAQQAVSGNDARLSDARTPTAHNHVIANITDLSTDAVAGTGSLRTLGTGATQAAAGNDARLSDARTPTAHNHAASDTNSGTFNIARIPTGQTGTTVPLGNDARFTDARTPTAHNHAAADVTYAGSTNLVAANVEAALDELDAEKSATGHTHVKANITDFAHTHVATTDLTATGTKNSTTFLRGDNTWAEPPAGGGGSAPAWAGALHTSVGDGEPEAEWQNNYLFIPGAALTPTLVTASVGRVWSYRSPYAITVNRLRWMQTAGTAAASNFRFGIWNPALVGAAQQILAPQTLTFNATANSWNSHAISSLVLEADTLYYCCLSATAVATTWSIRSTGPTAVGPRLQANTPGNLALAAGKHRYWFGQVALTAGVQPATMPALVQSAAWATAGLPGFLFDNDATA